MKAPKKRVQLIAIRSFPGVKPYEPRILKSNLIILSNTVGSSTKLQTAFLDLYDCLDELPDQFDVYRGVAGISASAAYAGRWWSSSREIAEGYAYAACTEGKGRPELVAAPAVKVAGKVVVRADQCRAA